MGDGSYENFYGGGISSFEPGYSAGGSFIGYRMNAGTLGSPTSIQTANQLKEVISRIKEGVKNVELQPLQEGVFDQIPKQNFEEMRALMKLTGVKPSVHAPMIDPSGFERGTYSEENRQEAERKLFSVIERAKMLDHETNVPVVIHSSSGLPGSEYRPGNEKAGEEKWHRQNMGVFNRQSKQTGMLPEEKEYTLGMTEKDFAAGGKLTKAEDMIDKLNKTTWVNQKEHLNYYMELMDNRIHEGIEMMGTQKLGEGMEKAQKAFDNQLNRGEGYIETNQEKINEMWNTVGKFGSPEQRAELQQLSRKYEEQAKKMLEEQKQSLDENKKKDLLLRRAEFLNNVYKDLNGITSGHDPGAKDSAVTKDTMEKWGAPKILVNAENFAREKFAETIGGVAWRGYNELGGDKAPMLAIENMYQGMAFSRAEDMEKLIIDARKKFVANAKSNGMGETDAEKAAEKLIGVTWDVGHLNLFKKSGFTDTDVIKQTEKIAPYVKHVHLTDNFGYSDSHLAPGMGNVPIKKILEELEKTGKIGEMRKIVEAGAFVQHFGKSPHPITMAALGSPIYSSGPYWNQVVGMSSAAGYFGTPMAYLPEKHFSMYGTGFSGLPMELGGQIPGTASRVTGTPNA